MSRYPTQIASLTIHRAFVVHFRTDADVVQGPISGRVEHVLSGQSSHFASLEGLLAFVAQIVSSTRQAPSCQEGAPAATATTPCSV
jgi:hypothetical protein